LQYHPLLAATGEVFIAVSDCADWEHSAVNAIVFFLSVYFMAMQGIQGGKYH